MKKSTIVFALMMLFAVPAFAQTGLDDNEGGYRFFSPLSRSATITNVFKDRANAELGTIQDAQGNYFARVTVEETTKGVIPSDLADQAIDRGVFSAFLQLCEIGYETRSYQPFADEMKKTQTWDERQFAYARRLHDVAMIYLQNGFAKSGETCGSLVKGNVGSYLLYLRKQREKNEAASK